MNGEQEKKVLMLSLNSKKQNFVTKFNQVNKHNQEPCSKVVSRANVIEFVGAKTFD